ncbi:16S rRNA (cytidine(1402)-2'-O)-methyltransferase [Fictibacillus aquaticus]|uniref:Ribosomal RNA small subunit methyltransferase I n=1 Tax=Fictibacillus aquaticus TaxID=2021314 RepID=A0A235F729_9BACL|nr:16S rRNA (cytidine(1402)-2'-O)-methyltransferase [Fictibacillus aquaticus]OYD57018.1 16S rRNA (cytidine(1402)-2'-O)-methyltransferase [Fictibacillus aquaticus]
MWKQSSYNEAEANGTGALYLVPTPVGNLEDMTFRAVRILQESDIIAAEDTRQTKKLCSHFEIATPLTSYHEHNKEQSGRKLLEQLKEGKQVALVTDAGMPGISDPGYDLAVLCIEEKIRVIPLPGASAALPAVAASGLSTEMFTFYGFLPRGKKERKEQLERLSVFPSTLIFYEAPHRIKETLSAMIDVLGDRKGVTVRELSKRYEEFCRGTLSELLAHFEQNEVRGEFCLVVEGGDPNAAADVTKWWEDLPLNSHVDHYINEGMKPKEAIKAAAADRGLPKRDVYQSYHVE